MLKKIYDLFSIVRIYDFMFRVVKRISSPFERIIIPFLNWRLRPERQFRPKRGSTLQLVIRPDERAYVGWPVLKYLFGPFIRDEKDEVSNSDMEESVSSINPLRVIVAIPLMAFGFVVVVWYAAQLDPDIKGFLFPNGIPDINMGFLPSPENTPDFGVALLISVVVFLFLMWMLGLILTYWRYEWERRHNVYAFFLQGLLHLEAKFVGRAVTPFYSGDNKKVDTLTPSDEIMEIELVTDIEDLVGGEKTSNAQDKWSQYLSGRYQVQSLRIASRSGAPDILRSVKFAPATLDCINQIVDTGGTTYKDTLISFKKREQEALASDAGRSNYDPKAGTREAGKVWENFDRLYPQPVKSFSNAFTLEDPGIWDRETGDLAEAAPVSRVDGSQLDFSDLDAYNTLDESDMPKDKQEKSDDLFPLLDENRKKVDQQPPLSKPAATTPPDDLDETTQDQDNRKIDPPNEDGSETNFWDSI